MITKEPVELAQVIHERLKCLYEETKLVESNEFAQKNLLTEILMDVQDLSVYLYKVWRDVR